MNDWMFGQNEAYKRQMDYDLYKKLMTSRQPAPPPPPSQADLLRSIEWTQHETFDSTQYGNLTIPKCAYCGGLCDREGVVHGHAEILRKALPPKMKGHRPGCKFSEEILPRIAELELGGE